MGSISFNSLESTDELNYVAQEQQDNISDEGIYQPAEVSDSDQKAIRQSKSGLRKVNASIQTQANLKAVLNPQVNQELVDILMKYGNNPDGIPALHYAVLKEDIVAIKKLVEAGADINSKVKLTRRYSGAFIYYTEDRGTAFSLALCKKNMVIAEYLLKHGAMISDIDFNACAYSDFIDGLSLLIKNGKQASKFMDLWRYIVGNRVSDDFLTYLVKHNGVNSRTYKEYYREDTTSYGSSLLSTAIMSHKPIEFLELLLDNGSDVYTLERINVNTPFMAAILSNYPEAVEILLKLMGNKIDSNYLENPKNLNKEIRKANADFIYKNSSQEILNTALTSIYKNGWKSLKTLLQNETLRNLICCYKENSSYLPMIDGYYLPIDVAIRANNIEVVSILLENGTDPNIKLGRQSCLKLAISTGNPELASLLLKYGAKIEDA